LKKTDLLLRPLFLGRKGGLYSKTSQDIKTVKHWANNNTYELLLYVRYLSNINENISHIDMFYRLMSSTSILCVRNVAMFIYYASIERKQYLDIYM